MAQRTVCLCDSKYIGIETIYTIVDGKQINIPEKLKDLREKSKRNQLFCPCGCGANLILVAGDRNLREQHFRLKDGESSKKCQAVYEGKTSIYSKIVLKCWLEDKLDNAGIMSRVPINAIDDINRKYEFTFLSNNKKIALSYCYDRTNLSDEKLNILENNSSGINIIYVLDGSNSWTNGQYPEAALKVQERQGYCLFLTINNWDYFRALMKVVFYAQDIDGLWEEKVIVEDLLLNYTINENGDIINSSNCVQELVQASKNKYNELQNIKRVQREEEKHKKELYVKQLLEQEEQKRISKQKQQGILRKQQIEQAERWRIEAEKRRIEASKTDEDCYLEIQPQMNQQEKPVYDSKGRRWIKCRWCGKSAMESEFGSYGGKDSANLGTCIECEKTIPYEQRMTLQSVNSKYGNVKIDHYKCPECGGKLIEKNGRYGRFIGCKCYPKCRYTRMIKNI